MKPFIALLLIGSIAIAAATYVPTQPPDQWRRRMMETPGPTRPSWMVMPGMPTKYPRGYSLTDPEIRLASKQYLEKLDAERKAAAAANVKSSDGELNVEKRRNLLVGRYGFRIGKRGEDDELTEADYQELVDGEESISESNPFGNFIQ